MAILKNWTTSYAGQNFQQTYVNKLLEIARASDVLQNVYLWNETGNQFVYLPLDKLKIKEGKSVEITFNNVHYKLTAFQKNFDKYKNTSFEDAWKQKESQFSEEPNYSTGDEKNLIKEGILQETTNFSITHGPQSPYYKEEVANITKDTTKKESSFSTKAIAAGIAIGFRRISRLRILSRSGSRRAIHASSKTIMKEKSRPARPGTRKLFAIGK